MARSIGSMACKGSLLEGMSCKSGEGLSIDHQVEDSTCTALSAYSIVPTRRSKRGIGVSQCAKQVGGGLPLGFFRDPSNSIPVISISTIPTRTLVWGFVVRVSELRGETRRAGEEKMEIYGDI